MKHEVPIVKKPSLRSSGMYQYVVWWKGIWPQVTTWQIRTQWREYEGRRKNSRLVYIGKGAIVFCFKAVCHCGEKRGENMSRISVESGTPGFVTCHLRNKRRDSRKGTWGINL